MKLFFQFVKWSFLVNCMLFMVSCNNGQSGKAAISAADSVAMLRTISLCSDKSFPSGTAFLKEWNNIYDAICKKKFRYGQLKCVRIMVYAIPRYKSDTLLIERCNELVDSFYQLSNNDKSWQPLHYFTLNLKGNLFYYYDIFDSARKYYVLSLNTPHSDSEMHYECIYNLALLHFQSNNTVSAKRYFEQSLLASQQRKDTSRVLRCMNSLAICSAEVGDTVRALYFFNEVDRWTQHDTDRFIDLRISCYHNLAYYYLERKQPDSAIFYFERSLNLSSKHLDKMPNTKEITKLSIAEIMVDKGKFAEAQKYFDEVTQVIRNTPDLNKVELENYYYEVGYHFSMAQKRYHEAISYLELQQQTDKKLHSMKMAEQLRVHEKELRKLSSAKTIAEKEKRISQQKKITTMWSSLSVILAFASVGIYRNFKSKQKLEKAINEKKVLASKLEERDRIAQEMHDDMGSTITSLQMALQLYSLNPADEDNKNRVEEISDELHVQMNEVIWRMNTGNDYVQNLSAYIYKFAKKFLTSAGIKLQYNSPQIDKPIFLSGSARHFLYLSTKELLNNIVKHSGANLVEIGILYQSGQLIINIRDNGKGFDPLNVEGTGNGLKNIRKNIESIGGSVSWTMQSGMEVTMSLHLNPDYKW